jgi:ring-1,2-phenylacetyl-CoA epoxidase subunit PaaC
LLDYAGVIEGVGRDEDDLAYLRAAPDFRNVLLVEQENGDFAHTIARQLFFSAYQVAMYEELISSTDDVLAGIAAESVKEAAYHYDHAMRWTMRLGDGTDDSRAQMQAAVDRLWPFTTEMFDADEIEHALVAEGIAVDPGTLASRWTRDIGDVLAEATLTLPHPAWTSRGGRRGVHGEGFGFLLAEMQYQHRLHPQG